MVRAMLGALYRRRNIEMWWRKLLAVGLFAIAVWFGSTALADDQPIRQPDASVQASPSTSPSFTDLLTQPPKFELRGRIEVDAQLPSQSAASQAQVGDLQGGFGFRRARIGAQGEIDPSTRWVAEVDFAGGSVKLRDMYVGLTAVPVLSEVRTGFLREPFSLEGATSSRFITFLERSPLNQLDPTRNWGLAGYWRSEDERMTAALGGFRDGTTSSGVSTGNGNAWAVTGRVTGLPVDDPDDTSFRLVHLGSAISLRQPADNTVTYKSNPQSNLLDVSDNPASPLLPSITIPAKSQQIYNLQAAAVYGPVSVQAEWFGTTIQQPDAGVVYFHGFYMFGSLFLTGEHRGYDRSTAAFDGISVRRPVVKTSGGVSGIGAVELAARFSVTNFMSPNLPPQLLGTGFRSPAGGLLYETTWGVNWYLNDYTRIMANYTLAIPDLPGMPELPVHVFGIRTAIFW